MVGVKGDGMQTKASKRIWVNRKNETFSNVKGLVERPHTAYVRADIADEMLKALVLVWDKVLTEEYHVKNSFVRREVEAAMTEASPQLGMAGKETMKTRTL